MNTTALQTLQHQQIFLRILLFSFTTVIIWLAFSIFLSQHRTEISPELQQLAIPLNPNIHLDVIDQIQQKRTFTDQELQDFPITRIVHNPNGTDTFSTTKPLPIASPVVSPSR